MTVRPPEIHLTMTMQDILAVYPSARRILFRKYHIGGCATCGYALTDTLEQVLTKHNQGEALPRIVDEIYAEERRDGDLALDPEGLKDALSRGEEWKIIDIREPAEAGIASIEGSLVLDRERALDILQNWPKDSRMVFYCHVGLRSLEAAVYFRDHGFVNAKTLKGGIDRWAMVVDPSLPRY